MRRAIAVILFTLFNLGAFGVTIEQHLCCHSQQAESSLNHCNDDESCCGDNDDCCDEIVSQVKIAKDFTSSDIKINLEFGAYVLPASINTSYKIVPTITLSKSQYATICYFPPPEDFHILYSMFLI